MIDNYENINLAPKLDVVISQEFFDSELGILFKKEKYSRITGKNDNKYILNLPWIKYVDTLFLAHNNWKKFRDIESARRILSSLEPSDLLEATNDFLDRQVKVE
ncbi:hypothetical protein J14TS2_33370 [Bacillus sp. J14TS2]|uniref:hypothetical protein n=1 Tax=Bacillus sp. J14TS2 TaxID=2807188 RepID=UPI001B16C3AF|nr:hypothetical protein [Bacillus sp. J14TS2]GIN72862.1 hypothetical protein J14TS2_33370 [Bacillus sp. J14TS2]